MVWNTLKKFTTKGRLETKLNDRLPENSNSKHVLDLHVDASKVIGEKLVSKFIELYDENTKSYSTKTPKHLMELRQTDTSLPYVFSDNIKIKKLNSEQVLSGLEGLAEGFHQTDHKGAFAQEITSIAVEYMDKFKNATYFVGLRTPYFFERLSQSETMKVLESLDNLNENVVKDFLENPRPVIDELKTEEVHLYLSKYNEIYPQINGSKEEFKDLFLHNVFDLKESTIKKKNVKLENLFENVLLRFDEYLINSNS
jgi:hypothetical protein